MDYLTKLRNLIGSGVQKVEQAVAPVASFGANLIKQVPQAAQTAYKAYSNATPYIPFAPQIPTQQSAQSHAQGMTNLGQLLQKVPQINGSPSLGSFVYNFGVAQPANSYGKTLEAFGTDQFGKQGLWRTGEDVLNLTTNPLVARAAMPILKTGGRLAMQGGEALGQAGKIKLGPTIEGVASKIAPELQAAQALGSTALEVDPSLGFPDFSNWVNSRKAIGAEKQIVKNQFADLKPQGMEPFFNIQEGKTEGRLGDVRKYLDTKYQQASKAGFEFPYQENYLTQIWNNTPEEIAQAFGKRVTNRPGFTMEKAIEDYKTGIEAGLKPKYDNLPDLLAHYEGAVNKAVADRTFINSLQKNSLLAPTEGAPKDWKTLNPDKFPRIKYNLSQGQETLQQGPFKAPKEIADKINNYLFNPKTDGNAFQRGLSTVADYSSRVKNVALSFGIPGTAINAHGLNILARHTLAGTGGNPLTRFAKGATSLVFNKGLGKEALPDVAEAIKAGLTIGVEDHNVLTETPTLRNKFGQTWNDLFEKPLFDRMIPNLKLSSYKALAKDFSSKMEPEAAKREAAKLVNNVYGGINWEQMGRNKDIQNFMRAVVLAPDWAESNVKLGGNILKSAVKGGPVNARYKTMMATILGSYVTANIANKLSSGHYMWENDSGHTFEVESGYTGDGQKRYVRPFGTAVDFARIPYDIALSLSKGDLTGPERALRNRASIPAGVAIGALTDTDYRGKPIGYKGKDQYGNDMPLGQRAGSIAGEAAQLVGFPAFAKQAIDTGTGKQGVEQGLTQGFELPFRYLGGAYSKSQQAVAGVGKSEGLKGKDLYDLNKSTQGLTLTKNQQELVRQGGTKLLPDIKSLKDARSQKNQVQDIYQQVQDGTLTQEEGDQMVNKILSTGGGNKQTDAASSIKSASAAAPTQTSKIQESVAKLKVEATGQPMEVNGKYIYQDPETGNAKIVPLDRKLDELKLTGAVELDKELKGDYKGEVQSKINDVTTLYKLGKINLSTAEKKIEELKALKGGGKGVSVKKALSIAKRFEWKPAKHVSHRSTNPYHAIKSPVVKMPTFHSNLKPFVLKGFSKTKLPNLKSFK
jgi:hypothetical protein